MSWNLLDFAAAFILIGGTFAAFVLVTKLTSNRLYRAAAGIGLTTLLAIVWIELAVGIF